MPSSEEPEARIPFWRCNRCGTPNPWVSYLTLCVGCGQPRPTTPSPAEPPGGGSPGTIRVRNARSRPHRNWGDRLAAVATWGYALLVLVALALIHWWGDQWWLATLPLYMPRWLFLPPLLILLGGVWLGRPRLLAILATTALVIVGPFMGLSVPIGQLWAPQPVGPQLRIMTFDQGRPPLDPGPLMKLVDQERIDVVILQADPDDRPGDNPTLTALFQQRGWHQDRTNRIASRFPIVAELDPPSPPEGPAGFVPLRLCGVRLRPPTGPEFLVIGAHLPPLGPGLEAFRLAGHPQELQHHTDWRRTQMGYLLGTLTELPEAPVLLGGDFQIAPDSPLLAPLRSSFRFAFDEAGWGYGYTQPTHLPWVRVDHLLTGPGWVVTRCWVGPDLGSDHLPLIAEVAQTAPAAGPAERRPEQEGTAGR